jgi:hypothetical protein
VSSVTEPTTVYAPTAAANATWTKNDFNIFPNPASNLLAIQVNGLLHKTCFVRLRDLNGRTLMSTEIKAGSTIAYLETEAIYPGMYLLEIDDQEQQWTEKINILP